MNEITALVVIAGPAIVGLAGLLWLALRRARKRARAEILAFQKRLAAPDLDGLERHLGHRLPASLRALYEDHELIMACDVLVAVPNPLDESDESYIAWFQPGDVETLKTAWPGCEDLFPIADNGFGDQFLVDPRDPDPEVIVYAHESGERQSLGVTLSAFLAAPRRLAPDE
jgi:SMI1-KNR4 cell-wall